MIQTPPPPPVSSLYRWRISFLEEHFDYFCFNETLKSFISQFASNIDGLRLEEEV